MLNIIAYIPNNSKHRIDTFNFLVKSFPDYEVKEYNMHTEIPQEDLPKIKVYIVDVFSLKQQTPGTLTLKVLEKESLIDTILLTNRIKDDEYNDLASKGLFDLIEKHGYHFFTLKKSIYLLLGRIMLKQILSGETITVINTETFVGNTNENSNNNQDNTDNNTSTEVIEPVVTESPLEHKLVNYTTSSAKKSFNASSKTNEFTVPRDMVIDVQFDAKVNVDGSVGICAMRNVVGYNKTYDVNVNLISQLYEIKNTTYHTYNDKVEVKAGQVITWPRKMMSGSGKVYIKNVIFKYPK